MVMGQQRREGGWEGRGVQRRDCYGDGSIERTGERKGRGGG